MKLSRYHLPTLKEAPAEAEVISHQLMVRAGMIRKLASGIYCLLPLGVRVIHKIESIIREEMNRAGAMEVILPTVQPAELWEETGRWSKYGKELLRIHDRHGRDFCYAPTAEEVITDLVRRDVRSYRDLPINLYQIQTKFRDEIRPRFGVMRAREFSMKDAYSFDIDDEGASKSFGEMEKAYEAIFKRCGIDCRAVEADSGQIGGSSSLEFMVMAESGEDTIAWCHKCDYAANVEKVEIKQAKAGETTPDKRPLEEINTPGMGCVDDVAEFLKEPASNFIKTLIFKTDGPDEFVAIVTRGDHEAQEAKVKNAIGANEIALAGEADVERITGAAIGFAGPLGLKIPVVADGAVKLIENGVTGANKTDTHIKNVNPVRDFPDVKYADIRKANEGDACPRCGDGALKMAMGIEVGHIFKLGKKYSEAMNASFLDKDGKEKAMIMGCYGIGVARTGAAAIEQNNDQYGIIWPPAIAPFKVAVLPLNLDDEMVARTAGDIYEKLLDEHLEPVIDDRDARPGVKFKDADLVGYPVQVVVGKKSLSQGNVEIKIRKTNEKTVVPVNEAIMAIKEALSSLSA
ncbi:Prolyl-tRNA synthetase, bacterial type [hydrothermal vent metagenome]|uniref:Proline--tRNA ligase n=1 Tax=hydrothermal vent metagenome TaxID=652676 RepID=A0A3B1BXN3_9ZZZZ